MDAIDLRGVKANTGNLIEGMEIKGTLGKLYAKADRIDLGKEIARLNKIDLSDTAITLLMNDTTTNKDTTSTAVNWKLMLDQIDLDRVAFAMQMPGDSPASFDLYRQGWINRRDSRPRIGTLQCIPVSAVRLFPELRR